MIQFLLFPFIFFYNISCSSSLFINKDIEKKWKNVGTVIRLPSDFKEIPKLDNPNFVYDKAFLSSDKNTEFRYYVHDFSRYENEKSIQSFYETENAFYLDFSTIWANITGYPPENLKYKILDFNNSINKLNSDMSILSVPIKPNSEFSKGYTFLIVLKAQKKGKGDIFSILLLKTWEPKYFEKQLEILFNSILFK